MTLIAGTNTPEWGHTWLTQANGRIYALRSLSDGSSLCVLEKPESSGEGVVSQTELRIVAEAGTAGKHSCHITILEKEAVVCDYTSGTLSLFPLDAEGLPCGQVRTVTFEGSGPNRDRQSGPHIHSSWLSPDGRYVVVADLGSDRLYRYDVADGRVDTDSRKDFAMPAGCGPRHCAFAPDGKALYTVTELSDEVLVYSWPEMVQKQRCTANDALPGGGGHIAVAPDGKHLYASFRLKNDGIAIFAIAPDGTLTRTGYCATGAHPRHFCICADGTRLIAACRDSGTLEVYCINPEDGQLKADATMKFDTPVYIDYLQ